MIKNCLEHDHEWIVKADSHDKKYYVCEWCDAEMFEMKTKTDQDECTHEEGNKEVCDNLGTYHVASETCSKCGMSILDWDKPHPTQIEEIGKGNVVYRHDAANGLNILADKLNEVIRRLNKLGEEL